MVYVKMVIRFRLANKNFTLASRFFVHFFAIIARLRRENAKMHNFTFCGERERKTKTFFFFS